MDKTAAETAGSIIDGERVWLSIGGRRPIKGYRERFEFRLMTADEAASLAAGERCWFFAHDGTAREIKVNGSPRTWKTRPGDVEIPVKYGLYEHARASYHGGLVAPGGVLLLVATDGTEPIS